MTQKTVNQPQEEGVEIPFAQLDADTLRRLIQDFVSRDGADWADAGCTLEDKVEQVLGQLRSKKIKILFDLKSATANFVSCH